MVDLEWLIFLQEVAEIVIPALENINTPLEEQILQGYFIGLILMLVLLVMV